MARKKVSRQARQKTITRTSQTNNGVGFGKSEVVAQGRLTLTSNTPVMTADAVAQTSVYYAPYNGNLIPIYNGSAFFNWAFTQLTMALNTSNQLASSLYDLFI